ncbi:PRC-barrel domain-containing protein [Hymenobacter sp. 5516J-16]|uniref:PRC-barrel domain-containing protein n=1 Tax=Hymenobacter sublimis TaxID=2933777 RepID=A0ABY4JA09_9BACT|nr:MULTISPECIES: PRC-barrel domain-containing protein [Hymenobacter]UOQ75764.1 PRC-barrel domain-containing protein [Hymenobacter sp. 5516J-16]UPL49440.1 PRC-barrel domain-containing protein [Hymenobacter sublimis]
MEPTIDSIPSAQGLHLRRLRDLSDFEVADGNPDVRGWAVRGADGQQFGQVHELIVDTDALKVRYLDVELDERLNINERDRHILLPIGVAALDEEADNVFVPSLTARSVLEYPPYVEIQISRQYEEAMLRALNLPLAQTATTDFYSQPGYDDHAFYQRRRLG